MTRHPTAHEARTDVTNEALAAWSDYLKSGLHLTGAGLFDWLHFWGTNAEKSPPVCND